MNTVVFENGLDAMRAQDYKGAVRDFEKAVNSIDEHHVQYNRIASYLGLARVLINDESGLLLCRDAASNEMANGDIFLNMACAEWHCENRKRAIDAINKGLDIEPDHHQLQQVMSKFDSRKRSIINFLARDHPFNRILGRILRSGSEKLTVHALLY